MLYIRDGKIVEDAWVRIPDGEPIPSDKDAIVTASSLLAADQNLNDAVDLKLGVDWPNHEPVTALAPHLDRLSLVALTFPSFRDGRAYTQARQLREQHGFKGEIRATGNVLRDQFLFMVRAGFNAFEVKKKADANHFAAALAEFTVQYQQIGHGVSPVSELRRRSKAQT